jgi:glycine/D-amino acid oxidase-like deaminating enzyme
MSTTGARWLRGSMVGCLGGLAALVGCGDDGGGTGGGGGSDATTGSSSAVQSSAQSTSQASTSDASSNDASSSDASSSDASASSGSGLDPIECEVVIVGGGAAGLHTAYRLSELLGEDVCLFEKEETLGGRIHDVLMDAADPEGPRFGVGARRIMPPDVQPVLHALADDLGLELETPDLGADLVNARGIWGLSKEALVPAYGITADASGDTETAFYEEILFGDARENAADYADFRTYVSDTFGPEGLAFLHDASRFRADFEAPLDAEGYMDYLTEEWDVYGTPSYPVGGMSAFIIGMEEAAASSGVRIFKGEPVVRIDRAGGGYTVLTDTHEVAATQLVLAVPPVALKFIEGEVVDDLEAQSELQDILAIKVVTVTQWWPENWWDQIVDPESGTPVWRGWTTESCINFIEIPLEDYARDQNVTRSVYDDDINCVELWQSLFDIGGEAAVEEEVRRGLEHLFIENGVTDPDTFALPDPDKTHVQFWPAAWHWLRAGTTHSNTEVFDWSMEPLPGEDVTLIGEAYNVNRSGWSDAAYKSSIRLLNEKFGMDLPGAAPDPEAVAPPRARLRAGHTAR